MARSSTVHPKRKLSEHFVNSDTEDEDSHGKPPAKRRTSSQNVTQTTPTIYNRDQQIQWNPSKACLCRLLGPVPYFDRSSPALGGGVHRLVQASSKLHNHRYCCPRCHPNCHTQRSPNPTVQRPPTHILEELHPIPQNWLRSGKDVTIGKQEQRVYDEQVWRIHSGLLGKLEVNPYRHCVCDVVGLDESIQVLRDPISEIDYAHHASKCLAYPIGNWHDGFPRPQYLSSLRALLPTVEAFRHTARSKKGVKRFRQRELRELEKQCGLHYRPTSDTACRSCMSSFRHESNGNLESVKRRICACCEQCRHWCICDGQASENQEHNSPNLPRYPITPPRMDRKNKQVKSDTHQKRFVESFPDTEEEDERIENPLAAKMMPLRPTKENTSRRKSEHAIGSKRKRRDEVDLEQENWPTSYNPSSIAEDILRAAGIHPALPPLNAHMKYASGLGELVKTRKGRKSRKTA